MAFASLMKCIELYVTNLIQFVITDKDPGKCTYVVFKKMEQEMTYD